MQWDTARQKFIIEKATKIRLMIIREWDLKTSKYITKKLRNLIKT